MNYYGPSELIDPDTGEATGRFHYTCTNDGVTRPVGNCSPWVTCPDCAGEVLPKTMGGPDCPTCDGKRLVRGANPCPGHGTPEEACEHQKQYELEHARFWPETEEMRNAAVSLQKCEACGHWTCGYAACGPGMMRVHTLCNEHCNRETLAKLIEVGASASSC